jgi:hypothetical protein
MVRFAFAIQASPNAVGKKPLLRRFRFFETFVYARPRPAVHMWAVLSGDKRSISDIRRSWRKYSAPHEVRNAKRAAYVVGPVVTRRMQMSSRSAAQRDSLSQQSRFWNQKFWSQKPQILYSLQPLRCLRSGLRSLSRFSAGVPWCSVFCACMWHYRPSRI